MGFNLKKEGCPFCSMYNLPIGFTDEKRGHSIIYRSNKITLGDPNSDWYALLQPTTPSNPQTGFNIQLMPYGHLENFSDIHQSRELSRKMGEGISLLTYAMQTLLEEEWDNKNGVFVPGQIVYGKSGTPENSQPHIHIKLIPFSGDVAQPFPSDAGWEKKDIKLIDGEEYVLSKPIKKAPLETERRDHIKSKLIKIINESL